jgi:hypothetical protein
MIKYAKVVNEETKQCEVGLGTNYKFYQSLGMVEMEVEQAYNGAWYVKGYAPAKPEEEVKAERIAELKKLLSDTDYKAIKYAEGLISEEEYVETKAQRQAWRDEINELQGKEVADGEQNG